MLVLVAIIVGAVLIPAAVWHFVGVRRHRDPLLLPMLTFALVFSLGGLLALLADGVFDWKLALGALALVAFRARWRAAAARPDGRPATG